MGFEYSRSVSFRHVGFATVALAVVYSLAAAATVVLSDPLNLINVVTTRWTKHYSFGVLPNPLNGTVARMVIAHWDAADAKLLEERYDLGLGILFFSRSDLNKYGDHRVIPDQVLFSLADTLINKGLNPNFINSKGCSVAQQIAALEDWPALHYVATRGADLNYRASDLSSGSGCTRSAGEQYQRRARIGGGDK